MTIWDLDDRTSADFGQKYIRHAPAGGGLEPPAIADMVHSLLAVEPTVAGSVLPHTDSAIDFTTVLCPRTRMSIIAVKTECACARTISDCGHPNVTEDGSAASYAAHKVISTQQATPTLRRMAVGVVEHATTTKCEQLTGCAKSTPEACARALHRRTSQVRGNRLISCTASIKMYNMTKEVV